MEFSLKKCLLTAMVLIFSVIFLYSPAQSCVGRVLTLVLDKSIDQKIVGNMLAVFINERTGTTVNLKYVDSIEQCKDMVKKGDADIFIDYIGVAVDEAKDLNPGKDPQETYSLVKQYYLRNYSMVWLKPFGYHGPVLGTDKGPKPSLAAAVTTERVLDRFPILDRVINKLSGRVDDTALKELIQQTDDKNIEALVRKFLKIRNLI